MSLLDEKGSPGVVDRALILPPHGQIGAVTPEQRAQIIKTSAVAGFYEEQIDRESAQEILADKAKEIAAATEAQATEESADKPKATGRQRESVAEAMAKSTARSIGSSLGRQLVHGVLGGLFRRN